MHSCQWLRLLCSLKCLGKSSSMAFANTFHFVRISYSNMWLRLTALNRYVEVRMYILEV